MFNHDACTSMEEDIVHHLPILPNMKLSLEMIIKIDMMGVIRDLRHERGANKTMCGLG